MEKLYVSAWMTPHPYTVTPDTFIIEAYQLMKKFSIRRLPVLDEHELVGIVTLSDIRGVAPLGSLDMLEVNYVLAQLRVSNVMTRRPVTISVSATVKEAAQLLLKHKFGGLPVLEDGKLVGIISEADIFRLVIDTPEFAPGTAEKGDSSSDGGQMS